MKRINSTLAATLLAATALLGAHGGAAASPTCTVWTDPANDEQSTPVLMAGPAQDLLKGTITTTDSGQTLVVRIYVQNLSLTLPQNATDAIWEMGWSFNTPEEGVAFFRVDQSGTVSYYDFDSQVPDTGSYVLGPNGYVEIDVPFSHLHISRGSVLHGVTGETVLETVFQPTGTTPFEDGADESPVPAPDYTVGSTC